MSVKHEEHKVGTHGYVPPEANKSFEKSDDVDLSDASLTTAWKDVTNDKTEANWCAFSFESGSSSKLVTIGTGSGGFTEVKKSLSGWKSNVVFGAFRVLCTDKLNGAVGSGRPKFVSFVCVGDGVPEYVRAAVNFQKGKVRPFFGSTHLSLDFRGAELSGLTHKTITLQMHDACAAHKPSHYDFYDGTELAISDLIKNEDDEESEEDFD
mmetsp:Transcript_37062/g.72801  ORF Transcript_37062/g.72801 Transcript_37062/m.72801 type:complete len:209 (+) Transcript_37062:24-650(+)|eukprot:CAMPEP_0175149988 /NCGR_PEP_ID=MMETSP0087-20121206/17588_1 /TAXON_ID=136419 /ORGANISM="Unknown Unknown, Strain D1" /LENGTH=208 /DNA_ID=CAMNT_0016435819 /DNA_START=22 /DNA_END=648 /DNA_ORIENTATION=-